MSILSYWTCRQLTAVWWHGRNGILRDKYNLEDRPEAQQSEVHNMSQLCTAFLTLHLDYEQHIYLIMQGSSAGVDDEN